jgi:hypothetical protein
MNMTEYEYEYNIDEIQYTVGISKYIGRQTTRSLSSAITTPSTHHPNLGGMDQASAEQRRSNPSSRQKQDGSLISVHVHPNVTRTAFSGILADASATSSYCQPLSSCGYASAISGYTASQGRLATWPVATVS